MLTDLLTDSEGSAGLSGALHPSVVMPRLVHAQVFHRHGARTPQTAFDPPADWSGTTDAVAKRALCRSVPLVSADGVAVEFDAVRADGSLTSSVALQPLPGGAWAGDLTVTGMRDATMLGKRLRQRYSHLLLADADGDLQLEVRSTPMRRTIETATAVLGALLPDAPTGCVIQLNTDDINKDWMLAEISSPCNAPELRRNMRAGLAAHAATANDAARVKQLCADAEELTGWTLPRPRSNWLAAIGPASDELQCRLAHDLWVGPQDLRQLDELARKMQAETASIFCRGLAGQDGQLREQSLRLGIGRCWWESCRRLRFAAAAAVGGEGGVDIDGVSADKAATLCLFSGHDSTLMPLMMTLRPDWGVGVARQPTYPNQQTDWPPFCADLAIELWMPEDATDRSALLVRAVYCGNVVIHTMADSTTGFCTLGQWEQMLAPFMEGAGETGSAAKL